MARHFFLSFGIQLLSLPAWSIGEDCSTDEQCPPSAGGFPQMCCNWDNHEGGVGIHMVGKCGEMCATNFKKPIACSTNLTCADSKQTCCSWNSSVGIHTTGVCGEVCALTSFVSPTNCTSDSECTGPKKCCKWDGKASVKKNGVCGDVCKSGSFVMPMTSCKSDSECTTGNMRSCCSWDNTAGKHTSGQCGAVCLHGSVDQRGRPVASGSSRLWLLSKWLVIWIASVFM